MKKSENLLTIRAGIVWEVLTPHSRWFLVPRMKTDPLHLAPTSSCILLWGLCWWSIHWVQNGTLKWSSVLEKGIIKYIYKYNLKWIRFVQQLWPRPSVLNKSVHWVHFKINIKPSNTVLTMGWSGPENITLISWRCLSIGSSCSCWEREHYGQNRFSFHFKCSGKCGIWTLPSFYEIVFIIF